MDKIRTVKNLTAATLIAVAASAANAVPIVTDIVTVVDESGSMDTEHGWLGSMIDSLHMGLFAAADGDTFSAQYGLVGFGGDGGHLAGHQHDVGGVGQEFGDTTEFAAATGDLVLNGYTEDGYSGITTALGYTGQTGGLRNVILVTDEDRDDIGGGETYASMVTALQGSLLNAVLNISVECGNGDTALGVDSSGTGYVAGAEGLFTTCENASVISGAGDSIADYVNLAFTTGGAAWDLTQLRLGGATADSFTAAFVDVKVTETIKPPSGVPVPGTLALFGLGIAGLGFGARKRASK